MEKEFAADLCVLCGQNRLDSFLSYCFPQFSRALLQEWIKKGSIRVNASIIKPSHRVKQEEEIRIRASVPIYTEDLPNPMDLDIIYEDRHLIIINKPAGLSVHPGAGIPAGTLLNALLAYNPKQKLLPRAGLVHRLDKGTSGLILVAKEREILLCLQQRLKRHFIQRRYLAIVEEVPITGNTINRPIARDPHNRLRFRAYSTTAAPAKARPAVTHYRIKQKYASHCLLSIHLETGRTHQIRCHLAASGHPLVGDRLYGAQGYVLSQGSALLNKTLQKFSRQALHAESLIFRHPHNGKEMSVIASIPEDMQQLLNLLNDCNSL